jgi:hypothetical protein
MSDLPLDSAEVRNALAQRVDAEALAWLDEVCGRIADDANELIRHFPAAGRKLGRDTLDPDDSAEDVHAWTIDDAGRVLMLVAAGDHAEEQLPELYRFGDTAERRGILRALPYLPIGDRGLKFADDAVRSNDTRLIAAALGPYATRYMPDEAYDHALLKCVFTEVPITPLHGVPERVTPNASRMLAALVHERIAAGRDIAAEVWPVIELHPPADELRAIEAELDSPYEDRRAAAERALAKRKGAQPH